MPGAGHHYGRSGPSIRSTAVPGAKEEMLDTNPADPNGDNRPLQKRITYGGVKAFTLPASVRRLEYGL